MSIALRARDLNVPIVAAEAAVEVGQGAGQQRVRAVAGLRQRLLGIGAAGPAGGEQQVRDGLAGQRSSTAAAALA
jgi:hypothetical protein